MPIPQEDLHSTVQALKNLLPLLQHRSYPHSKVVTMICDLERSIHILERAKRFLSTGLDSIQEEQEEFNTSLYPRMDFPMTSHERRQDVAALESIIPDIQNAHAECLMLALKLKLEAEQERLLETETSRLL